MKVIQLSISIVAYDSSLAELESALASVRNTGLTTSCYVVDNSPSGRFRSAAEAQEVRYLFTGLNLGFAVGHNQVLRLIGRRSQYHLIMNPDVCCDPGVVKELYAFMQENPHVGWVMPEVRYPDGTPQPLCKRLAAPTDLLIRRFFPEPLFASRRRWYECADLDLSVVHSVPCLSGCFMFLRTDAVQEIGGFDERFFLYMEDFDLARRLAAKWETVYYPHTRIIHRHGRGSYRQWKLLAVHMNAAIRYFCKWGWFFDPERERLNGRVREHRAYRLPCSVNIAD